MTLRALYCWAWLVLCSAGAWAGELPAPTPPSGDPVAAERVGASGPEADPELVKRLDALEEAAVPPEYLVALLPDPVNSFQARELDLFLTALIRAFELHGYQLRDSWLPDFQQGLEPAARRGPQKSPGLMLFEDGGARDTLVPAGASADPPIAVLIVGESPAQGAQRDALWSALDLARGVGSERPRERIRVLGPSFSGTVSSLKAVLSRWLCERGEVQVSILSGSASNPDLGDRLEQLAGVSYRRQATSDRLKLEKMVGYLRTLGIGRRALLVENSTYGRTFSGGASGDFQLVLPFPMHISAIRSARSGERHAGNGDNGDSDRLQLDLADRVAAGLPLFEPEATLATYGLVLERILKTLARQRVEAVGIVATNIKDKIFLADEITRYVPNVRLFTFEGDELLAHPDYARATRGMLVASSHAPVLRWTASGDPDETPVTVTRFGNDASHGVFEATFVLIGELLGRSPRLFTSPSCCHLRAASRGPERERVWIGAVGREGIFPLAVQAGGGDGFRDGSQWEHAGLRIVPRGWILICLLTLLALLYLAFWVSAVRKPIREDTELKPWGRLRHSVSRLCFYVPGPEQAENQRRCRIMSVAMLGIAALAYLVLAAPLLERLWRVSEQLLDVESLAIVALMIPVLIAVGILIRNVGELLGGGFARYLAAVLVLPLFYLLILVISRNPAERALDLDSGVSPTLPILLLLVVCQLWVLAGVYRCQVMLRLSKILSEEPLLEDLAEPRGRLIPSWKPLRKRGFLMLATAALVIPGLYLFLYYCDSGWPGIRLLRGIEESLFFDGGISLLLAVSLVLVAEASFRYFTAWKELHRKTRKWLKGQGWLRTYLNGQDAEANDELQVTADRARAVLARLIGQIRTLMLFANVALVIVLVACLTYPFEPDRVLALYLSALIAASAATALAVNLQIGRSECMRLIRGRTEGWWDWERLGRLAFYLAVPGAGLIASRFPGTLDKAFGFLEPFFNVFG